MTNWKRIYTQMRNFFWTPLEWMLCFKYLCLAHLVSEIPPMHSILCQNYCWNFVYRIENTSSSSTDHSPQHLLPVFPYLSMWCVKCTLYKWQAARNKSSVYEDQWFLLFRRFRRSPWWLRRSGASCWGLGVRVCAGYVGSWDRQENRALSWGESEPYWPRLLGVRGGVGGQAHKQQWIMSQRCVAIVCEFGIILAEVLRIVCVCVFFSVFVPSSGGGVGTSW